LLFIIKFMHGFALGTLVQCLLKFSKRIFAILCLAVFGLIVLAISTAPYEVLLAAESYFWTWDNAMFLLGCFAGNFFGDEIYDWLKEGIRKC